MAAPRRLEAVAFRGHALLLRFGVRTRRHDDHLRIDFGLDSKFLPSEDIEGSLRIQQSNLRSLLHLVSEIDKALPLERRLLWSESGANFAEVLEEALERFGAGRLTKDRCSQRAESDA